MPNMFGRRIVFMKVEPKRTQPQPSHRPVSAACAYLCSGTNPAQQAAPHQSSCAEVFHG